MTHAWEENSDGLDVAEVRWSTGTILSVFFAATLISALFFGMGFTFGHGGSAEMQPLAESTVAPSAPLHSSKSSAHKIEKPSAAHLSQAQSALIQPVHRAEPVAKNTSAPASTARTVSKSTPASAAIPARPKTAETAVATPMRDSTVAGSNRYMVQVGAIGNRKDALMLVARLRKQNFHAEIYPGKRDKFLHVQLGPFDNKQQAEVVRHQLISHGHYALLKPAS